MNIALFVLFGFGVVVPYAAFVPWVLQHGLDIPMFWKHMFANRIATFFALDVIISAVALIAAALYAQRQGGRGLIAVSLATLLIGVSAGLPLYLYFRWRETSLRPSR